ncbi:MAG: BrnA antitoxin family protein [Burkholderiales bacterium]|nr:BrnA antitoxin family protein [Burkholderiales bacterium]
MSNKEKVLGTDEAWESGQLGSDGQYASLAAPEISPQVDDALGLQMISIRLDKSLIESFKILGSFHGVGYQPLMRDALKRFAESEMKAIVSGLVESQKKQPPEQTSHKKQQKVA